MSERIKKNFWRFRPLLTETLPYELPVIFGNDRLYYSQCRSLDPLAKPLIDKLLRGWRGHTVPYSYGVRKDSDRTTQLGLVHPITQLEFCDFYARHESSILDYCNRSEYSLRRPAAVAAVYVASLGALNDSVHKTGEVHLTPEGSEPELSKLVSYFAYEKYNLLNKFYESREFIRLEKKFELLKQLDISKCFYSIYTHSITWATKSKEFAKKNKGAHSFESSFDSLMQRSNYNETNGIVVGPEFARIFAEIILQDVDQKVQRLLAEDALFEGQQYSIRRYVDDYSVFSNSAEIVRKIESLLRRELLKYKLHVNESKVRDYHRPFVSNLTQARADTRTRINGVSEVLVSPDWKAATAASSKQRHAIGGLIHDLRVIAKRHDVPFSSLSGSLLGSLRALSRAANKSLNKGSTVSVENWIFATRSIIDCAFYITSVDLRVRTTYGLCQLLSIIQDGLQALPAIGGDFITHTISEELVAVAKTALIAGEQTPGEDSVELFNLLICGSHLLKQHFTKNGQVEKILDTLLAGDLTYFKYITLKYCYLRDPSYFAKSLTELNQRAESLLDCLDSIKLKSERFHLLCDYLSAPDVDVARKRAVFVKLYGGTPSNAALTKLGESIGFTDWTGMWIEHSLKRRQMRPVYAVA